MVHSPATLLHAGSRDCLVWTGPSARRRQTATKATAGRLSAKAYAYIGRQPEPASLLTPATGHCCRLARHGRQHSCRKQKHLLEMTSNPIPQTTPVSTDSLHEVINKKVFIPNPTKATWLALVIPGGGQIYNRKYWKLPIIYGGFAGCAYALTWNSNMYKDYMQAYKDASNENWEASSINNLLPPGYIDRVSKKPTDGDLAEAKRYLPAIPRPEYLRFHRRLPILRDRRLCRCRTVQLRHHPGS